MRRIAAILVMGMAVMAQTPAVQKTAFEVASVKLVEFPAGFHPNPMPTPSTIHISGNGVSLRGKVTDIVLAAYNLKGFQIEGAPAWANSTWYEINAKAEGNSTPTAAQSRQMLQTLLAERFQSMVHYGTKEMAVYDLIIAKGGPKFKETAGDRPPEIGQQRPLLTQVRAFNRDMANIIAIFSVGFDRPVLDKTGLNGRYDFSLEFSRNNAELHPFDSPEADHSVFDAVEQQLGLKLIPTKEPVEIIVIESVSRPSEN